MGPASRESLRRRAAGRTLELVVDLAVLGQLGFGNFLAGGGKGVGGVLRTCARSQPHTPYPHTQLRAVPDPTLLRPESLEIVPDLLGGV